MNSRVIDPLTGRPLTWHPDRENRDSLRNFCEMHQQSSIAFRSVTVPEELTYDWITVEDQGQLGSCQGHAITTCAEVLYYTGTGGEIVQLSRRKAYIDTQEIDGLLGADNGSTIDGGRELATRKGFSLEIVCPYQDVYPSKAERDRILAIPREPRFLIKSGILVESYDHCLQLIAGGMVISIGTAWGFTIDEDWVVRRWNPPTNAGGHARYLGEIRNRRPTEINSWGRRWGRNGRFSWERQPFEAMLRDPRSVVIALSDLATPKPKRVDFAKALFG